MRIVSQAHFSNMRAVGGAAKKEPAMPRIVPIPIVATPTPMAIPPKTMNCDMVTVMNCFRLPMTILDMISSTASGIAFGKPKHCRTCSHRILDTVGVPIMPEKGRGTIAVRIACVPSRIHSVIAESILCSTSTTCAATAKMRTRSSVIRSRVWVTKSLTPF